MGTKTKSGKTAPGTLGPVHNRVKGTRPRQCNKTLYVSIDDLETWNKATRMFPFFLNMSVSQFCTEAVKKAVSDIEQNLEKNSK